MRTTLDLDEELVRDAMRASGAPTKTALVELGLRAVLEQAARRRLAALAGTLPRAAAPARRRPRRR